MRASRLGTFLWAIALVAPAFGLAIAFAQDATPGADVPAHGADAPAASADVPALAVEVPAPSAGASSAAPVETPNAKLGKRKHAKHSGPYLGFGVQVSTEYTSNLFHEWNRRLPLIRSPNAIGERYYGMVGPEDLVTTPGSELNLRWKHRKRDTKLSLGAEYAIHARNPTADYVLFEAGVAHDLTRRDSLSLDLQLTPSRFKKNYLQRILSSNDKVFARADYLEWEGVLDYNRKWAKRWRTTLELGIDQVRYDDPFTNHDENTYAGGVSVEYEPWKRLTLALGVDAGTTLTPDGEEDADVDDNLQVLKLRVDRGHDDIEPSLGATFDLPSRFEVETSVAYRFRRYTSSVAQDVAHFDRVDRRLTLGGGVTKHFGPFALALDASFADSDAFRKYPGPGPDPDPDAYGYEEFSVGLTLEYEFDGGESAKVLQPSRGAGPSRRAGSDGDQD